MLSDWLNVSSCDYILKQEIHIWKIPLNLSDKRFNLFFSLLSSEEQTRAQRFYFDKDRRAYVAVRGHLRWLLGRYLARNPLQFIFEYNAHGKPFLAEENICFNVSHSKQLGLIAFDPSKEIGIDIEWMRPDFGGLKIAKRFFSEREVKELEELEGTEQKKGFFNGWARKEAYIKARGRGLAIPLSQFSVQLSPNRPCRLLSTEHDPPAVKQYLLKEIKAHPEYAAAVAFYKNRKRFKMFSPDDNFYLSMQESTRSE